MPAPVGTYYNPADEARRRKEREDKLRREREENQRRERETWYRNPDNGQWEQGNTGSWDPKTGKWRVHERAQYGFQPPPKAGPVNMSGSRAAVNPNLPPEWNDGKGLLGRPGIGENWYEQNKGRWQQPRKSVQYWQGRGARPNQTSTNWGYVKGQLQNLRGSSNVRDISSQVRSTPMRNMQGERFATDNLSYFTKPGEMEQFYGANKGFFATPGQGESWVRNNMGGFEKAGVAEGNYDRAREALGNIRYGEQSLSETRNALANSGQNTVSYFGETRPFATSESGVEDEYSYFQPSLRNKSYTEQVFESGSGGLIDPYARAQEKQIKQIRDAAAARGMFNTGKSLRAEQELAADVAAEEARDRIALARSADDAFLGRTGAAQSFASAAEQAALGRRQFGLEGAIAADESNRANIGLSQNAYKFASDEALGKVDRETTAAQIAQQQMIERLMSGGRMSLEADDRARQRMDLGATTADRAQTQGRSRITDGARVASDAQRLEQERLRDEVDRLLKAAGLEVDADQLDMQTLESIMRGSGQVDDQWNEDDRHDFDMSRQLDADDLGWLESEFGAAKDAQGLFENRNRNALGDIAGNARDQAGVVGGALANASSEEKQMAQDVIQALMQQYGMDARQAEGMAEKLYQTGQLAIYAQLLKQK